jgi:ribosomal subunit interface protein
MKRELQITYHGLEESDAIKQLVERRAQKLERLTDNIISCEVCIELPHQRHRTGNHYRVRVALHIPQKELVVDRDPKERTQDEDAYQAVGLAFDALDRQLRDELGKRSVTHGKAARAVLH